MVCRECGIVHHRECWEVNRRCTTYGCDGRAQEVGPDGRGAEPDAGTVVVDLADLDGGTSRWGVRTARPADEYPPVDISADETASLRPQRRRRSRDWSLGCWGTVRLVLALAALTFGLTWWNVYVTPPRPPVPKADTEKSASLDRVIAQRVRLRARPSEQGQTVAELRAGTTVRLLATTSDWAKVRTRDGKEGYVPRSALRTVESQRRRAR